MPIVTLTTDYGIQDFYVAALKGVILEIAPEAQIVDITHDIEPHDILRGAFVVRQAWPWFKEGTVHVAVIDPGVGSERRIILGTYAGRYILAPDNGLVTFVHRDFPLAALYAVQNADFFVPGPSATFHGRDIMAPVAAHLARGVGPADFGPAIDDPVLLPIEPEGKFTGKGVRGRVLYVDRFGTMITNIHREQLARLSQTGGCPEVWVNDTAIGPVRRTFSDVSPGEPVALIGGTDFVEIAINQGRAVDRFGPPDEVRVQVR